MKKCFMSYYSVLDDSFISIEVSVGSNNDRIENLKNKGYYFRTYDRNIKNTTIFTNEEITEKEFIRIYKKEMISGL